MILDRRQLLLNATAAVTALRSDGMLSWHTLDALLTKWHPSGSPLAARLFDAHEHGPLATWETTSALVCVTRERSAF
jgi:hypothetical protein